LTIILTGLLSTSHINYCITISRRSRRTVDSQCYCLCLKSKPNMLAGGQGGHTWGSRSEFNMIRIQTQQTSSFCFIFCSYAASQPALQIWQGTNTIVQVLSTRNTYIHIYKYIYWFGNHNLACRVQPKRTHVETQCCFVLLTRGWGRLETRPPVALGSSPGRTLRVYFVASSYGSPPPQYFFLSVFLLQILLGQSYLKKSTVTTDLGLRRLKDIFLSFFLSWVSNTQPNHCTNLLQKSGWRTPD